MFERVVDEYDRLMNRKAFLENYTKMPMFKDNLHEFEDSREVVCNLINEYREAEHKDYGKI